MTKKITWHQENIPLAQNTSKSFLQHILKLGMIFHLIS